MIIGGISYENHEMSSLRGRDPGFSRTKDKKQLNESLK